MYSSHDEKERDRSFWIIEKEIKNVGRDLVLCGLLNGFWDVGIIGAALREINDQSSLAYVILTGISSYYDIMLKHYEVKTFWWIVHNKIYNTHLENIQQENRIRIGN